MLRTYTCLIVDNRYSVPSLAFHMASNDDDARAFAQADLAANPHHEAVEVRRDDEVLFIERRMHPDETSLPQRTAPGPSPTIRVSEVGADHT